MGIARKKPKLKLSVVVLSLLEEAAQEVCREWGAPGNTRLEPSPRRWLSWRRRRFPSTLNFFHYPEWRFAGTFKILRLHKQGKGECRNLMRCSRCLGDISGPKIRSFYIL